MNRVVIPLIILVASSQLAIGDDPSGKGSAPSQFITGIVQSEQGTPIADAAIGVGFVDPKSGVSLLHDSSYEDSRRSTRTDQDGRFSLGPLDRSLKFRLTVIGKGHEPKLLEYRSAGSQPLTITLKPKSKAGPPERTLNAQVVDAAGSPLPGALVKAYGAKTPERRWMGSVPIPIHVTDEAGKFSMLLPDNYQAIQVRITADGTSGTTTGLLYPGKRQQPLEVPTGTTVTGRLLQEARPVAGLRIAVVQENRGSRDHFIGGIAATTDADGRFEFRNLPASQKYVIYSPVRQEPQQLVLSTKKFNVPGNGESRDLGNLRVTTSLSIAGTIVFPDGYRMGPGSRLSFSREPAWDAVRVPILNDGSFLATGLPPEAYEVRIQMPGLKLDGDSLRFQQLSGQSFGIRLRKSVPDLQIRMVSVNAEKQP